MRFRAATFNIHHGRGADGEIDLGRTAGVVRDTEAAFVALQEVDRNLVRSGGVDQPAELARMTGMEVQFFPVLRRARGEYGLAIATQGRAEARFESLPRMGDEEERGLVIATWKDVTFLATHLSRDRRAREEQARHLARVAAGMRPPVVLLGDLNQRAVELGALRTAGFFVPRGRRPTVGLFRRRQVDHIVTGPGVRWRGSWTLGVGASDHLALVAELETP